jgi:hypothetical protein
MIEDKRSIQSLVTGRIYVIHKELSPKEAELANKKIKQLEETEKESDRVDKELSKVEHQDNVESLIRMGEINIKKSVNTERVQKIQAELNGMMSSTLHSCFNLTIADIDKIDLNERVRFFLGLADACK